jgi:CRISPR system Cascade subunit CasB
MRTLSDWPERLTKRIFSFVENKDRVPEHLAALAGLRRGLGKEPGDDTTPFRYIADCLDQCTDTEFAWAYRVSALCAWHQGFWPWDTRAFWRSNLGASMYQVKSIVAGDSVERRFNALLNCHADDLPVHLRHAIGLLRSNDVPVDWVQLVVDVLDWQGDDREVQRRWARSFWRSQPQLRALPTSSDSVTQSQESGTED